MPQPVAAPEKARQPPIITSINDNIRIIKYLSSIQTATQTIRLAGICPTPKGRYVE